MLIMAANVSITISRKTDSVKNAMINALLVQRLMNASFANMTILYPLQAAYAIKN
jgi:hypothetical protein